MNNKYQIFMRRNMRKIFAKLQKKQDKIAVLRLSGIIGSAGMFKKGMSIEELDDDIEKAFSISSVKAVALQINSPGGSPVQSELIYKRIRSLSEEKNIPVYTFIEDVAASGGYWLACAGDEIYASVSSVVGSIGVISSGFGFVEAIKKIGVERRVYTQGANKSILDPFKEVKEQDIEILLNLQKDVHEAFKDLVRSRRGDKIKASDEAHLYSGEFYNGIKACQFGLVDKIGDMRSVMTEKYGKKVKFEKIIKSKGWLKRKISASSDDLFDNIVNVINDKIIWNRYGL
jgi:signal peptide peptidase SppA